MVLMGRSRSLRVSSCRSCIAHGFIVGLASGSFIRATESNADISWSSCEHGGTSTVLECENLCAMQATSLPGYSGVSLAASAVGKVYSAGDHGAGIQVTIDPNGRDYLNAFVDNDGALQISLDWHKVNRDPQKHCIHKAGLLVELWRDGAHMTAVNLASSATLNADELNGVATINVDSSAEFHVGSLYGRHVRIGADSSGTVDVSNGDYDFVKIRQSGAASVNLGSMTTKTAFVAGEASASLKGLTTTGSLKVDISSASSIVTSAGPDASVTGVCNSAASILVNNNPARGVSGPCNPNYNWR
eukprot:TRINITY_DN565_c0_g1_i1.p1 TRINITY_DN565_c0_g1~~TRINITY_DN565_c0_g1_i1.p1  ORF type:complete len:302 (+),score=34.54 TRINITY_DN565_c0_g1_i1:88-993(+)